MENTDTRYPYTYATDFIRTLAGYDENGTKLSRSDASCIRQGIAEAIGMIDAELARKLADYYKQNESDIVDRQTQNFIAAHTVAFSTADI